MSSLAAVRSPEPSRATPAPIRSIISLGMDVHKDSITIAVLPQDAKTPTRLERLPNDLPTLQQWIARVARDGEWSRVRAASRVARVRLRVRGDRPVADPAAPWRPAQA